MIQKPNSKELMEQRLLNMFAFEPEIMRFYVGVSVCSEPGCKKAAFVLDGFWPYETAENLCVDHLPPSPSTGGE